MKKLESKQMKLISGGMFLACEEPTEFRNPDGSTTCDVHYDHNENGKVDNGECVEIVKC